MIGYYGEHARKYVFMVTVKYIKSEYRENDLPGLRAALYDNHQSQWGFPDIATINKAVKKFREDKSTKDKNLSYTPYHQDLSITDEEWKSGFAGLDALKKAVEIEEGKKQSVNTHISNCKDCQFMPVLTESGFEEHKECIDCGKFHANFKQAIND